MVRSKWKNNVIFKRKNLDLKKFKIFNSNFIILKDFVGFIFFVYTGNKFKKVLINQEMVGYKLCDFIFTRFNNGAIHTKKKKKKKKKIIYNNYGKFNKS
jgi:ribosomal protein S19